MEQKRVVIMGAAGRDFHNFNVVFRDDPDTRVVAFTATQIPGIDRRRYPPELAGPELSRWHPHRAREPNSRTSSREQAVDEVIFAYSDVSHEFVMHQASRVLAAGADFALLGPDSTAIPCSVPVISVLAVRTGAGKSPASRFVADLLLARGPAARLSSAIPCPTGISSPSGCSASPALEDLDRYGATVEEREDYEPHIRRGSRGVGRGGLPGHRGRGREGGVAHHLGRGQQRLLLPALRPGDRRRRPVPARVTSWPTTRAR